MSVPAVVLGTDVKSGEPVCLPQADRLLGTYVIGANGTGKTTLIENLIAQDIAQGLGLCVVDPHGDLIEAVLARGVAGREEETILWDLGDEERPFGLNLFACADPNDEHLVGRTAEALVQVFKKVWGEGEAASWGPRLEDLLRNVAVTLISNPGMTLLEIPRLLSDRPFREALVAQVGSPAVADFWRYEYDPETDKEQREHRASTLNKVRSFLINPIVRDVVGQSRSTLDIPRLMAERRVLLVKLAFGRVGELPVSLLGSVLVAQLFNAAMARVGTTERPQFNLYLDEYHRFATPAVSELLTEVRKFGVATTIAHQARYQLDSANRGASLQSGTLIVFRVGGADAEELASGFDATPPPPAVIGERAKKVVCQEPVQALLRTGPPTDEIRRSMKRLRLAELFEWAETLGPGDWMEVRVPGWTTVRASKENLRHGIVLLNRYLVDGMEGRVDYAAVAPVWKIVDTLSGWLGLAEEGPPEYVWESRVREFVRALLATRPPEGTTQRQMASRAVIQATKRMLWPDLGMPNTWPELTDLVEAISRDAFRVSVGLVEEYDFHAWVMGVVGFVLDVQLLAIELRLNPILVPGSQYEPIYDKPRSYADVQAEIANELANLPRFTARCKVLGAEHTARTLPSPVTAVGPVDAKAAAEVAAVRERSRRAFGRPREAIREEIERRQRLRAIDEAALDAASPPPQRPSRPRWESMS